MQIVQFPHPVLRYKSVEITRIDESLRKVIAEMLELMYEAKGVGLAANQVGLPFRFFVANFTGDPADREEEFVFLNPVITSRKGSATAEEGCLSLPGLYADVTRPEAVTIEAFDLQGQGFRMKLNELPARIVQHETDHLDGVLFLDRLTSDEMAKVGPRAIDFETKFRTAQKVGEIPADTALRESVERLAKSGRYADE